MGSPGWATRHKLDGLRANPGECRAVLERSGVAYTALPEQGEGRCLRNDRTVLDQAPLLPDPPPTTCAVAAGFDLWLRQGVQPAADELLGAQVARIEHLGAFSCRRLYGSGTGPFSEHATANAIDLAAFDLDDRTQISVLRDWDDAGAKGAFLRDLRDGACDLFGTTLGPDYNAAHRDHFHLDMRGWKSCR